jgi:hypothetical protein
VALIVLPRMWQILKNLATMEHAWGRMWQLLINLITMKRARESMENKKREG